MLISGPTCKRTLPIPMTIPVRARDLVVGPRLHRRSDSSGGVRGLDKGRMGL